MKSRLVNVLLTILIAVFFPAMALLNQKELA